MSTDYSKINGKYPIYIISKGRWESRLTSRALEAIHVPYKIAVEPQEFDQYAAVIDPAKILVLPFSNLGQGSIPARNFCWEHSIQMGATSHWILDDNIRAFYRLNRNTKLPVDTGAIFRACESFVDRYENVDISGMNYRYFAVPRENRPPYTLNTRVYSCILLRNHIPERWRGRYNEDTDLSLRILKRGACSILFNAFLCDKMPTLTMKGGNTGDLYKDDGRLQMAKSLVEQHPDVTRVTWKWGRAQHEVNYAPFQKNRLKRKPGVVLRDVVNNFGMVLKTMYGPAVNPTGENYGDDATTDCEDNGTVSGESSSD